MTETLFDVPRDTGLSLVFTRKPVQLSDVNGRGDVPERVFVVKQVAMSTRAFDAFTREMHARHAWLAGLGGYHGRGRRCVEVIAPQRPRLFIDPQGYDYARAVALIEQ